MHLYLSIYYHHYSKPYFLPEEIILCQAQTYVRELKGYFTRKEHLFVYSQLLRSFMLLKQHCKRIEETYFRFGSNLNTNGVNLHNLLPITNSSFNPESGLIQKSNFFFFLKCIKISSKRPIFHSDLCVSAVWCLLLVRTSLPLLMDRRTYSGHHLTVRHTQIVYIALKKKKSTKQNQL